MRYSRISCIPFTRPQNNFPSFKIDKVNRKYNKVSSFRHSSKKATTTCWQTKYRSARVAQWWLRQTNRNGDRFKAGFLQTRHKAVFIKHPFETKTSLYISFIYLRTRLCCRQVPVVCIIDCWRTLVVQQFKLRAFRFLNIPQVCIPRQSWSHFLFFFGLKVVLKHSVFAPKSWSKTWFDKRKILHV